MFLMIEALMQTEHMDPQMAAAEKEHEELTKVKNIETVVLGRSAFENVL